MPLLKGKKNIGHNIKEMEASGHPPAQAKAAALRTALDQPQMVTSPNAGTPSAARRPRADDGSYSVGDMWPGNRS